MRKLLLILALACFVVSGQAQKKVKGYTRTTKSGKVVHAFLGLSAAPVTPQLAQLFHLPTSHGLLVQDVQSGSGADKAGIKAGPTKVVVQGESYQVGGDIITAINGVPVTGYDQLRDAVSQRKPGDKLELTLYHNGSKKTVTATLGTRPGA